MPKGERICCRRRRCLARGLSRPLPRPPQRSHRPASCTPPRASFWSPRRPLIARADCVAAECLVLAPGLQSPGYASASAHRARSACPACTSTGAGPAARGCPNPPPNPPSAFRGTVRLRSLGRTPGEGLPSPRTKSESSRRGPPRRRAAPRRRRGLLTGAARGHSEARGPGGLSVTAGPGRRASRSGAPRQRHGREG